MMLNVKKKKKKKKNDWPNQFEKKNEGLLAKSFKPHI